jgi:hypothetical protein
VAPSRASRSRWRLASQAPLALAAESGFAASAEAYAVYTLELIDTDTDTDAVQSLMGAVKRQYAQLPRQ